MRIRTLFSATCVLLASAALAEPPPLADFAKQLQYDDAKISPQGGHLAAIVYINDRRHLALVDLKTMKAVNVRPREDDELATFDWVSENRLVYTLGIKLGGIDRPVPTGELFGVNADGGGSSLLYGFRSGGMQTGSRIKQVTSERGSARLVDSLRDSDDDILVAIDSWDAGNEGDFSELTRMDARTGKRQTVTKAPIRRANFLVDHKGRARFTFGEDSNGRLQVYYRGDNDGKWEMVLDELASGKRAVPIAFSRDNETVYWGCATTSAVGALCTWTDKQRELKAIWTNKSVSLDSLITSLDGQDVIGVRAMPGRPSLDPLVKGDPTFKTIVSTMQQFPGDDVSIVSATDDGNKAIVLVSADVNPGGYYLYEKGASKLTFLVPRAPWIKPDQMAMMEPIEVKARDGIVLHGYLTRPVGKEEAKNLPLVVMPHGGPHQVRDVWGYDAYLQALASRGYAVLQINFRGSEGYGAGFRDAGYREWGAKMQDDVTDATKWAISSGAADPKRICIFGASYGGYAALQGAVREPELYRCAIGEVGVYDLPMMFSRGDVRQSLYGENYLKKILGDDMQALAGRSPINGLDRLKAKVMLIVGGEDRRVPPVQGENLHNALVRRKVEHEWLYQANEGHGFYKEPNRLDMLTRVIAFLDANTKVTP